MTLQEPPAKIDTYNPLGLKIGSTVSINLDKYKNLTFRVHEIREYNHFTAILARKMVEYVCQTPLDTRRIILRLIPTNKLNGFETGEVFRAILLTVINEFTNESDINKIISVTRTADTYILESSATYFRYNSPKLQHHTQIKSSNANGDTIIPINYWDYGRSTTADGIEVFQFLYIEESNLPNRTMQFKHGVEIPPESIICIDCLK